MSAMLLATVFVATVVGTGALRRYAISRQVIDVPNARSSHQIPTARGGGAAIVLTYLAAIISLTAMGVVDSRAGVALIAGGAIVALAGFVDDHRHIQARWRLLAHYSAAFIAIIALQSWTLFGSDAGIFTRIVASLVLATVLVWLLNLYNFMDGIDGIAGVEAVTACIGGMLLPLVAGGGNMSLGPAMLAVAAGGFLVWNFPSARIFMGDVGSGFLGYELGVLALIDAQRSPRLLFAWAIMLAVFVTDATVTILRRLVRGERIYEAHRMHAYQRAARKLNAHWPVTLVVGGINLGWLLPWALLVAAGRVPVTLGVVAAYLPIVLLVVVMGGGRKEV